ncbi:hypothetical protein HKX48_002775 [Thoreauomyces humboldtii]|nr:hypothetical protein HKX48_002775 [Thoreauomyces humboldtii]
MSARATSIYKIQAVADFLAPKASSESPLLLSFRASQAFYVLATDEQNGLYFVSTQYATPFSRSSTTGLVPISHFEQVELLSRPAGAPTAAKPSKTSHSHLTSHTRRHSEGAMFVQPQSATVAPPERAEQRPRAGTLPRSVSGPQRPTRSAAGSRPPGLYSALTSDRITDAEIVSAIKRPKDENAIPSSSDLVYAIRVRRAASMHLVSRSYQDFTDLHDALSQFFGPYEQTRRFLPSLPSMPGDGPNPSQTHGRLLATYLTQLCHSMPASMFESEVVTTFFAPRTAQEAVVLGGLRRDSGFAGQQEDDHGSKGRRQVSRQPVVAAVAVSHHSIVKSRMDQVTFSMASPQVGDGVDEVVDQMSSKLSLSASRDEDVMMKTAGSFFDAEDFLDAYT